MPRKTERAKTGWIAGAFGWQSKIAKTTDPGHFHSHTVTEATPLLKPTAPPEELPQPILPAATPSAPPEDLPKPIALEAMNVACTKPLEIGRKPMIEDLEDEAFVDSPDMPLINTPAASYARHNNTFEGGPLPDLPPLQSLQIAKFDRGQNVHDELKQKMVVIDSRWQDALDAAQACKASANLGVARKKADHDQLKFTVDSLIAAFKETNQLLSANKLTLVAFDTPRHSGKDICAKIDDQVDFILNQITRSWVGIVEVRLPDEHRIRIHKAIREVKELCFVVMSGNLKSKADQIQLFK